MRIATMIISLLLMVVVGLQSCTVYVGGSATGQEKLSQGGAVGLLVAFLFLIAGAFALAFPLVSLIAFVLAALMALVAYSVGFSDMWIWAIVAVVLAAMSFFGFREKRKAASRVHNGTR